MVNIKYKRTKFIVKKGFQLRYIGLILAVMLFSSLIAGYTIYYNSWVFLGSKLANVYPQGMLAQIFKAVNFKLTINLTLIAIICVGIGIIASHRIAGPIDRMVKFLNSVKSGDYSKRLKLREKDELVDLANAINELVDKLEGEKKAVSKD
jgi:HAMP domain-containing protein